MKFNYKPKDIQLYREFVPGEDEIRLEFINDEEKPLYIYRRVVIRDSEFVPVAEGRLYAGSPSLDKNDYYKLQKDSKILAWLYISKENLSYLQLKKEYSALIQYSDSKDFSWSDKMLASLEIFRNWDSDGSALVLDEIARLLPVQYVTVPLHTRPLLEGANLDLCMDFGTSFSTCAMSINPAKSSQLACFKANDKPASLYYTQFQSDADGSMKRVVPSVMALKRLKGDDEAEWLFGYDALNWVKNKPEKGSFISDIKSRLLNLEKSERIYDQEGKSREFTNREIARAFLNFLVESSKRHFGVDFKSLHITTPVIYPDIQRRAYEAILKEDLGFSRLKNKLDEARAPLYHFLADKVESSWNAERTESREKPEETQDSSEIKTPVRTPKPKLSYLIIDCGGGSTDATLVRDIRLLRPTRAGGGLVMKTEEPKPAGNPDFGGTNLTELLFHYIKMRLLAKLRPEEFKVLDSCLENPADYLIDSLIDSQDQNIFWELYSLAQATEDKDGDAIPLKQHEFAYRRFEEISKKMERIFPTDADRNLEQDQQTWEKINHNRNTLLQLAEQLKVAIYATDAPKDINIKDLPNIPAISFWQTDPKTGELAHFDESELGDGLVFRTYELNKLFRPIIFKEISRILRQLDVQGDLSRSQDLFNVRFVGQSTNIPLFNEALAFFVPRAMIEEDQRKSRNEGSSRFHPILAEEKKICCVTGAASFLDHLSRGCLKNANFVAAMRVLKNFCRFGKNGSPISAGVYNFASKPDTCLIQRGAPLEAARGAIVRDLADDMEEYFGSTYDENVYQEGFINFSREDLSRQLSEEEQKHLYERWGDLFKAEIVNSDPADPGILIEVEVLVEDAAQRYEFHPYFWDHKSGKVFTTQEPLSFID